MQPQLANLLTAATILGLAVLSSALPLATQLGDLAVYSESRIKERGGDDTAPLSDKLSEKIVSPNRVTKVVKGGRIFHFSAPVVVGNCGGTVCKPPHT